MARVQAQFKQFNDKIRLDFEHQETLREKRDIIRCKLKDRLPGVFEKYGEECPVFRFRDQGSYEMKTGTNPLNGDFDIDQGLYFEVSTNSYPDPVVLKERVYEALVGHTDKVTIRRSCVTVFYHRDGEAIYHVDIAIYSDGSCNSDGRSKLAKGKQNSSEEYRLWVPSDPQGLTEAIFGKFQPGFERRQLRRVVRYLKRWKDVKFSNGAPLGISLTVAASKYMQPTYTDVFAAIPDDLGALRTVVVAMLNAFTYVWDKDTQQLVKRLQVTLPVEPYADLFSSMTNAQMEHFEDKLKKLRDALDHAARVADPVDACEKLHQVFGDDFPVPEKSETAKSHAPAIISSGNSG